ncbi:MAG: type II restriction endonuclease [Acidobacteriaceae bacterium]
MKQGYLSQFFSGVAIKQLRAVEADQTRSHQHEFNGVAGLKNVFGPEKNTFEARFVYISDNDDEPVVSDGTLTWYDARAAHTTRTEYRMYFPTTPVSQCAAEGDILVVGRRPDDSVLVIIAQGGSTIANQVLWLFRISLLGSYAFSVREELETEQDRIEFTSRFILEQIGIPVETTAETYLDAMLEIFGPVFPPTRRFSEYARSTVEADPLLAPDAALMAWMDREEILFRTLEKHILADRLAKGFENDVEGFLEFSKSVQNRRKSRVGFAVENHVEVILASSQVQYSRAPVTEGRSRPDFLFPGAEQYRDQAFDPGLLSMLGVKSTCKDRWRQVLAEAVRVPRKHLLTLETAISTNQTDEMRSHDLQLVVPRALHGTYNAAQQNWLLDVSSLIAELLDKQRRMNAQL